MALGSAALLAVLAFNRGGPPVDGGETVPQDALIPLALPGQNDGDSAPGAVADRRLPFEPKVPKASVEEATLPEGDWVGVTVAPGDNLSLIFSRLTLSKRDLHAIVSLGGATKQLRRIKPGQGIRFRLLDGELQEMVLEIDKLNSLRVLRGESGFTAQGEYVEPEVRVAGASTAIKSSLFVAGQRAGLSDAMIMRLTEIFGWDIDFALDIREDDRFSVVYEEIYKDDELVRQDRILAAEFVNRGKTLRAVLYTDSEGRSEYFSDTGKAMRKAFLRTPVNFTRISSRFNLRRKHPILNTIRAHRGVDYAAPSGTPVRATADGKIQSVGNNGGYGKTVVMQHGKTYSTLYAHLSRFARGLQRGRTVKQGQVIGYVGKSGLATGPHLHYEFRVNGVHRNPLTVDLPKAQPIDARYLAEFQAQARPLLKRLDTLVAGYRADEPTLIARLEHDESLSSARPVRRR